MGKKSPSPPPAPDPVATANAQGAWNTATAMQQQAMNMVGQNTPWGTLDYTQNGFTTIQGPNGPIQVKNYTANVNLTPEQQAIFEQTQAAETNLAQLANQQSAALQGHMAQPFEYSNQDAENWAYDLGSQRLDPRFAQAEDSLRTKLINQGIREGSPAWDREMSRLGQERNDAYNQLMLTGRGQAFGEALSTRNQPINEITALLSGSQVSNPAGSFAQTPQTQVGGVDYGGIVNSGYQNQMTGWGAQQQNRNNMMGGLFGLGSSLIGLFSDMRLKEDISRVGTLDNGIGVYLYRYAGSPTFQIGVLAQEVEKVAPAAVIRDLSGFLKVRYDLAVGAH